MVKCRRCGKCCLKSPCFLSRDILGNKEKCKALEKTNGNYTCGLVREPSKYIDLGLKATWKDSIFRTAFSDLLGIGTYCDSDTKFTHIAKDIFGDISDELVDALLWSCTSYPDAPPSKIIKQLKDAYVSSKGDPINALKLAEEEMSKAMNEIKEVSHGSYK